MDFGGITDEKDPCHNEEEMHNTVLDPPTQSTECEYELQKKRKRQEGKLKCEQSRRIKFKEQMETLRSLVISNPNAHISKFTRDTIMDAAIDEIQRLRKEMSLLKQMFEDANFEVVQKQTQASLQDPYNRNSYSMEDLERAFEVMFVRQIEQQYNIHKNSTAQDCLYNLKVLQDIANQTSKQERVLRAAILELAFYTVFKFSVKDITRVVDQNWLPYQEYLKTTSDRIVEYDADIGALLLQDTMMAQYTIGNFKALEQTHNYLKMYLSRCDRSTCRAGINVFRVNPGAISLKVAYRIHSMVEFTYFDHFGKIILGSSLINNGDIHDGVAMVERGIAIMFGERNRQEASYFIMGPAVLNAYLRAGCVDKGLRLANFALRYFHETDMETTLGTAEVLRLKANLLTLKHFPDFIPEPQVGVKIADNYAEDILDVYESLPKDILRRPAHIGPLPKLTILERATNEQFEDKTSIESIFKKALELAHAEGFVIVELHCSVDLIRYYMHVGNMELAWKTVPTVKEVISRMKCNPNTEEIHRANFVISLADPSILMKQVEQE